MAKRARARGKDPRTVTRKTLLALIAGVLGIALLASAWQVRRTLVPDSVVLDVHRTLRPGRFEERIPIVNARAVDLVRALPDVVAAWDTSGTEMDREIGVRLREDVPLEEGNRRLSHALARAGLQVLDARTGPADRDTRGLVIDYGYDDRHHGRIRLVATRYEDQDPRPKVALVLDDLGRLPIATLDAFLGMDFPLTVTVLPQQVRSRETVLRAREMGREVLLHLPMEPLGYPRRDPGEGAVLVDMSEREIRRTVARHLEAMPGVQGVSNHTGSMATQNRDAMTAVFLEVQEQDLYFFDSKTTDESLAARIAREEGYACLENDLFLDNVRDPSAIRAQLARLVEMARSHGNAIGIFHPHPECLEAIPPEVARYQNEEIRFVTLRDLDSQEWVGALPARR